jgi:hypothetical protein
MAEADLDVVIRSIGKKQHETVMAAARKRHARLMGLAAKAKTKETKNRFRQTAKTTLLMATAAARRLKITAENAALRAIDEESRGRNRAGRHGESGKESGRKQKLTAVLHRHGGISVGA